MKRWIFLLGGFLLLLLSSLKAEDAKIPAGNNLRLQIRQFGGINTKFSTLALENGQTPDSENVLTDLGQGVQGREGFVSFSTDTASGLWVFALSNGTKYIIRRSSGTLTASPGSGTFFTAVSTVPASGIVVGAQLGDKWFFASTDGLKYWDGSNTVLVDSTLTFNQLVTHKGRLWGSGISSAARTLYGSAFNDGTSWTLVATPADTDPTQIVVGGGRDEIIAALYASFQDKLMWFTPRSFGALYGGDRSDFSLRTFSQDIGTGYPESIQDCDGRLRWLGPRRTIWEFDGVGWIKISEEIDTIMQGLVQGDASTRSFQLTSQTDFAAGTLAQTSASILAGSVAQATWTATDTSSSDFNQATLVNMTTQTVSGSVYLSTNNVNLDNNSFESGSGETPDNWTAGGDISSYGYRTTTECSVTPYSGSYMLHVGAGAPSPSAINVYVLDPSNNVLGTTALTVTTSWVQQTLSLSSHGGRNIKIRFEVVITGSIETTMTSDTFFCSGQDLTFYVTKAASVCSFKDASGVIPVFFDLLEGGRSTIYTGSIVGRNFDTAFSTPAWLASGATWTTDHTFTSETQTSADGVSFDSLVSWSTGSAPTSAYKRYIRYKISVSTTDAGTALPAIDDATFAARASTGSWISANFSLGAVVALGRFTATALSDSATITYAVYTDSDTTKTVTNGVPVLGTFTSSQTVTSGSLVTLSTAAYAFFGVFTTLSAATQEPAINDLTLEWNEGGSTLRVASAYPNQRYWLSVAQGSATNNRVLVFDRAREWQIYTGINADAMILYNADLFFSNSTGIFQGESSYADNGSAIASYFTTKTYNLSNFLGVASYFDDLYVNAENSDSTLATTYQVDNVTTDYSLASTAMSSSGLFGIELPFPSSTLQQGRYIRLKFSVSGTNFWKINGADFSYIPDVEQQ